MSNDRIVVKSLVAMISIMAVLQWGIVLDRTFAAIWAWYKFHGFGNEGYIDVGKTTQAIFLTGSVIVGIAGYLSSRAVISAKNSQIWKTIAQYNWLSIAVCTLFWVALLMSPIVRFSSIR